MQNTRKAIIWLCLAHFTCDIYGGFINPILPFIASKLDFSMSTATIIVAITQICSNMLQPIFGFFADNILKRFFIFWGLILASLFIPLTTIAPGVFILIIFMVLGSLGGSFFHPQSMGYINLFSKENYSKNMGLFISLGSAGYALGPLIATLIMQYSGLEKIIFSSCIGSLLAFAMFLFVPKFTTKEKEIKPKVLKKTFREIFSNKQINYLMVIAMMKSLVTNSSCILLPFLWKSLNFSPFYIGIALFLFIFAGAIGSLLSPYFEKIIGTKPLIYISLCGTFPMMLVFSAIYSKMPIFSLFTFSIIGFITMLAQPVTMVLAQKTLPEYKSIIAGLINGFCWGTVALCLSFIGIIAEKFGIIKILLLLTLLPILCINSVKKLKSI